MSVAKVRRVDDWISEHNAKLLMPVLRGEGITLEEAHKGTVHWIVDDDGSLYGIAELPGGVLVPTFASRMTEREWAYVRGEW